jgi:rsbT co-antagonist protein RsbR
MRNVPDEHYAPAPRHRAPAAESLRALWEAYSEGLALVDADGIIGYANPSFCAYFGYDDQTVGMSLRTLQLAEADWSRCEATLRGDAPAWQGALRYAHADGSVLSVNATLTRLEGQAGAPMVAVTVRDAADQTRRETELRVMSERMQLNLATTPLAVVEWDIEGRIVFWNRSAERIFGYEAGEVLRKPFLPLIVPNLAQDQVKGVVSALLDGNFANSRNINVTKDGRAITCQWYNTLLHDDQGNVVAVISQADDVTAVERAEEALRESQRLLAAIVDNLPSCLSVKDREGRYLLFNRALERLHGRPSEDVVGRTDRELWPDELVGPRRAAHAQTLAAGAPVEHEETVPGPEGPRSLEAVDFPVFDETGAVRAVCSVASDVTARRRVEDERAALQQQIILAQESALHELSSPLIPLARGVLVMPLVGLIDEPRARRIMELLLTGITEQKASVAILDITGVRSMDAITAETLPRIASAARLLGAQVILTGVSPAVADALVTVGVDTRGIVTLATLEAGIAHAFKSRAARRSP